MSSNKTNPVELFNIEHVKGSLFIKSRPISVRDNRNIYRRLASGGLITDVDGTTEPVDDTDAVSLKSSFS